jgi:hypothetical protein
MMATHPNKFVLVILIEYLISIRNDGIPTIIVDNSSFYNRICTWHVDALERNHYNGFRVIHVNFGAIKPIVIDLEVEILVNLLSITPFHNIITTKSIPPNPWIDPP